MTYNAHKKAAWVLTVTAINHITSCGWWDHLLSDNAVFFFQHLLWVFLCTVLLRTSRCQAMGEHDSPSEDKFTSTSFFFSWNLSYALRDGTSVAIQHPFRKPPRERQTCQLISLSLPPLCCHCAHQSCLETFTNTFFLSMATGSRRGKREGTWPWCWKWIQCAWVFIYDLTNELPVSSEMA